MTTERVLCMYFGYVPIFIGGGEGLRVEQQGLVRGAKKPSLRVFLRSQKKWKIALSGNLKIRICASVVSLSIHTYIHLNLPGSSIVKLQFDVTTVSSCKTHKCYCLASWAVQGAKIWKCKFAKNRSTMAKLALSGATIERLVALRSWVAKVGTL